jgi:hypothetical protein
MMASLISAAGRGGKREHQRMWQQHLIIVGVLVALALPLYLLDYFLLKSRGDIFLLNIQGMLISFYAIWLAIHIPVSSLALYLSKTDRLYTLHVIAAVVSAGLLFAGFKLHDRIDAAQSKAKREARMAARQGLFDAIKLEKWWYVPDERKPEAIGAVFVVTHSGRLAASVVGRTERKNGSTVYSGEMKPQKRVQAGDRIEYSFPLKYYSEDAAPEVSFSFGLFPDKPGSVPENVFKDYAAGAERVDDGQRFLDALPPPVAPRR